MGHTVKKIFHGAKHVVHGVEHVLHGVGHIVEKITPWNDHTFFGKLLDTALVAVGGYYAGGALGLWNTGGTLATTTTGGMSTLGGTLPTATNPLMVDGVGGVASSWLDLPSMSTISPIAAKSLATTTGEGLFSSIGDKLGTAFHLTEAVNDFKHNNFLGGIGDVISGVGSGIWSGISKIGEGIGDFAKEHPLLAGSLASGILQGVGGYMQAQQQEENFNKLLEERQKEFNERHNMGLTVTPGTYNNPYNAVASANLQSVYNTNPQTNLFSNMNWHPNFEMTPNFFNNVNVS